MNKITKLILGMPKTIYYNFMIFDAKTAMHLPLIVAPKVKIRNPKHGRIRINGNPRFGLLTIGMWDGSDYLGMGKYTTIEVNDDACFCIDGHVSIASGSHIFLGEKAELRIGSGFKGNYGLHIVCRKKITLGNDVLVSWNCTILDSDGHEIFNKVGMRVNADKDVNVGNHVWIGADVTILKGSHICDECVIGSNSVVHQKCDDSNSVYITDSKMRIVSKDDINWKI